MAAPKGLFSSTVMEAEAAAARRSFFRFFTERETILYLNNNTNLLLILISFFMKLSFSIHFHKISIPYTASSDLARRNIDGKGNPALAHNLDIRCPIFPEKYLNVIQDILLGLDEIREGSFCDDLFIPAPKGAVRHRATWHGIASPNRRRAIPVGRNVPSTGSGGKACYGNMHATQGNM
ncbi:MAG TPA: hypothetical protein VGE05_08095 [Novosphingobium sp.]